MIATRNSINVLEDNLRAIRGVLDERQLWQGTAAVHWDTVQTTLMPMIIACSSHFLPQLRLPDRQQPRRSTYDEGQSHRLQMRLT